MTDEPEDDSAPEKTILPDVTASAFEEIDHQQVQSSIMPNKQFDVGVPCQLRFVDEPQQDTARFHNALDIQGFSPTDTDPAKRYDGEHPNYEGEVVWRQNNHLMKALVFRGDLVRIYPRDEKPSEDELELLIHSIGVGWKSQLYHDPIEEADR